MMLQELFAGAPARTPSQSVSAAGHSTALRWLILAKGWLRGVVLPLRILLTKTIINLLNERNDQGMLLT
jgi:hypothetical protein